MLLKTIPQIIAQIVDSGANPMKLCAVLVMVFAASLVAGQNGTSPAPDQPSETVCGEANTQIEINQCLGAAYQKADKKMNELYSQIIKKRDAAARNRLQAVQRLWIKYRDANCSAAAALYQGGSIQPSVRSGCLERLTRYRIDEMEHVYSTNR
jgi:uncharacterized protein YecT (DUF1311 family)